MKEFELKKVIAGHIREISHYSQMQVFATSYYQKNYFQLLIDEKIAELMEVILQDMKKDKAEMLQSAEQQLNDNREFTLEELSYYDGSDGKPAYVAVNGDVYDLSMIAAWAGGSHFGLTAGNDYTAEFTGCHQGSEERLNNIPKIGRVRV
ncbi:MAG: heme/steroid binding protein [Herbinix sp.]|jgi:predicted heme/steroid binding protein|nr:heme/steroid binding protein [Herbinix sp.]